MTPELTPQPEAQEPAPEAVQPPSVSPDAVTASMPAEFSPSQTPTSLVVPPEHGTPNPAYVQGTESPGSLNLGGNNYPKSPEAQTLASGTTSAGDPAPNMLTTPESAITPATGTTSSGDLATFKPEVLSGGVKDPAAHHGILGKLALKLKLMK